MSSRSWLLDITFVSLLGEKLVVLLLRLGLVRERLGLGLAVVPIRPHWVVTPLPSIQISQNLLEESSTNSK